MNLPSRLDSGRVLTELMFDERQSNWNLIAATARRPANPTADRGPQVAQFEPLDFFGTIGNSAPACFHHAGSPRELVERQVANEF